MAPSPARRAAGRYLGRLRSGAGNRAAAPSRAGGHGDRRRPQRRPVRAGSGGPDAARGPVCGRHLLRPSGRLDAAQGGGSRRTGPPGRPAHLGRGGRVSRRSCSAGTRHRLLPPDAPHPATGRWRRLRARCLCGGPARDRLPRRWPASGRTRGLARRGRRRVGGDPEVRRGRRWPTGCRTGARRLRVGGGKGAVLHDAVGRARPGNRPPALSGVVPPPRSRSRPASERRCPRAWGGSRRGSGRRRRSSRVASAARTDAAGPKFASRACRRGRPASGATSTIARPWASPAASASAEEPGRNVRQKAGLNGAILNARWHQFATILSYKIEERGGQVATVPARFTSQTCAACGVVDARSRGSQARCRLEGTSRFPKIPVVHGGEDVRVLSSLDARGS
ncbi:hypothetical protein MZTS_21920 [Methylorubrum zatmanii]|nr:hypothetical protein [Methylorubrum zatmanii]